MRLFKSAHPAVNGHATFFRAGEGGEKNEWRPISAILLPVVEMTNVKTLINVETLTNVKTLTKVKTF